jgi:dipeptidyl aminopeptidase/acylaminoacyl peptidase
VQLTHVGQAKLAGVQFSPFEPFTFTGWNGETVHGWVFKPAGWRPGQRYPTVLLVHGGPQSTFSDAWSWRWNPQVWAGWGYGVVMIDPHGSSGYGQAFTDAVSGHWGDRPLEDLQKGWTAAQAKAPWIDTDRACAAGASYGGFMVYWMAGVWNQPWKCLIDHDGVFDNRIMGYATEELWFAEWENGHATPWQDPAAYETFNPVNHVADWSKPMLVIHSDLDFRIPVDQGIAAFTALQRKGIESRFLNFPDENHWVLKPKNSLLWHDTIQAWLGRWIGEGAAKPAT